MATLPFSLPPYHSDLNPIEMARIKGHVASKNVSWNISHVIELVNEKCRLFSLIPIVNPPVAQRFETKSLAPILQRFSVLNYFVIAQKVNDEWRAHALLNFSEYDLNVNDAAVFTGAKYSI
ncbi:hypothetical protein EVAR_97004_1 [Eumeta japonica]|uniref:Tc1-like transposase DDE domain-containing protein n=1 Tax=Eumeta variegata TaxID=151549 RepID=A0A4C2A1Q8_EUMVA|nr:hypothetical protein EVAR_97004_1 [Eumeta japonica]